MLVTRLMFVLLTACVALGCKSYRIETDFDPAADFSALRTFAWLEPGMMQASVQAPRDDLMARRVRAAVDDELSKRGFSQIAAAEADVLVAQHYSVEQKFEVDNFSYGYGYGWHSRFIGVSSGTTVRQYDEGTLVLDFVQPEERLLIWRGIARGRLRYSGTPEEREARVREVVGAILDKFPPASKQTTMDKRCRTSVIGRGIVNDSGNDP